MGISGIAGPGTREYAGLVTEAPEAGMRLLAEIVQDRLNGPRILHDAWTAGRVSDGDLQALIPDTWLYVDWPERVIGAGKWVQMFRAAGFLSIPYGLPRPENAITAFRGATEERRAGMSWTTDINRVDLQQEQPDEVGRDGDGPCLVGGAVLEAAFLAGGAVVGPPLARGGGGGSQVDPSQP
jgi:hypothetical protein